MAKLLTQKFNWKLFLGMSLVIPPLNIFNKKVRQIRNAERTTEYKLEKEAKTILNEAFCGFELATNMGRIPWHLQVSIIYFSGSFSLLAQSFFREVKAKINVAK